jgi:hypothetical protein
MSTTEEIEQRAKRQKHQNQVLVNEQEAIQGWRIFATEGHYRPPGKSKYRLQREKNSVYSRKHITRQANNGFLKMAS